MIAVADAAVDGNWDFVITSVPAPFGTGVEPGRVHANGANVLFCDGHVQWYPQSDLVLSVRSSADLATPENLAKRRMWNCDHEP